MTCHDAREQLTALLDDALAAPERAVVDAHLASCAECRRELEQLRATVALIACRPRARPRGSSTG
jgi:anti-sigma factor RsiW